MIYLFILFIIKKIINFKRRLLKTTKKYKIKVISFARYFNVCLNLNYLTFDKLKEYNIKQITEVDHIISCVLYNQPKLYKTKPNVSDLKAFNVNIEYPIIYVNKFDYNLLNNFLIAKKYVNFNLVIKDCDLINNKKINQIIIKLNALILNNNFASLNLITSILALNVFCSDRFKVKKNYIQSGLTVVDNGTKLENSTCIQNGFLSNGFKNDKVSINIINYKNDGDYFQIVIKNLYNTKQCVELVYNLMISRNNYIESGVNYVKILNLFTTNVFNLVSDTNLRIEEKIDKTKTPVAQISKKCIINPKETKIFHIYYGTNCIAKEKLNQSMDNYQNKYQYLIDTKIKTKSSRLNYLFNFLLPKFIKYEDIGTYREIQEDVFDIVYNNYKIKNITALEFYMWLKQRYLGIQILNNFVKFDPILKDDFEVILNVNQKQITMNFKVDNHGAKYIQFDNIKYYNYNIVPLSKLKCFDNLLLVI